MLGRSTSMAQRSAAPDSFRLGLDEQIEETIFNRGGVPGMLTTGN